MNPKKAGVDTCLTPIDIVQGRDVYTLETALVSSVQGRVAGTQV